MRAIPVDIHIEDGVIGVEFFLHRREDEDIIEVAFRDVDVCVLLAVDAEETRIFFELLPQILAIAHQKVHLTRIVGFEA